MGTAEEEITPAAGRIQTHDLFLITWHLLFHISTAGAPKTVIHDIQLSVI